MALKPWISIPNIKIYLEIKFRPNRKILYFGGHFGFKMAAIANQRWISIRNIIIYLETKSRPNRRFLYFGGHFVLWLPWERRHFEFFSTPKSCHTLRWIFLQSFMKFDERNPKIFLIPLFCFHGNCGKVCPTDSDFFGLSRSTRCQASTLTYFSTCPFGQLTKKSTCPTQSFSCPKKLIENTKTRE